MSGMKVYLATSGEYSSYQVVRVFARKEDAEAYELADAVEEFEVGEGPVEVRRWYTLRWYADQPDIPDDGVHHFVNPSVSHDRRDFDGRPGGVRHEWREQGRDGWILMVQGWDLERVRKVYSEQRAQHIARRDMGVEGGAV